MTEAAVWLWASFETVAGHLEGVSLSALGIALALHTLKLVARARAWQNIVRAACPHHRVRYRDAAVPLFAGIGAGAVAPLGGEVLRVVLLRARLGGVSSATLVGSLAVERALDILVAAAVVPLAVAYGFRPGVGLHESATSLTALLNAHALGLAAAGTGTAALAAGAAWLLRRRLAAFLLRFAPGLRALSSPKQYAVSVASWQLLSWALRLVALDWFLRAFHIPGGIATALLVLAVQLVAGLVPLPPGGAGTQQALIVLALAGTSSSAALVGFSAGSQAATVVLNYGLGALALVVSGRSLRIRKLALEARRAVAIGS